MTNARRRGPHRSSSSGRWGIRLVALLGAIAWAMGIVILQPTWALLALSPLICPQAAYGVETNEPVIALTIDDGPDISVAPDQSTTEALLQRLDQYEAHATFFPISTKLRTVSGAALARKMVEHGNELGNHFTQDVRSIRVDDAAFVQGIRQARDQLAPFGAPPWFRPAGGWCSRSNADAIATLGYQSVLGTIWPYDTHMAWTPFATWQIARTLRPGAILILHDGGKSLADGTLSSARGQRAVQILDTVLPMVQQRGYRVVTLSELAQYGPLHTSAVALPQGLDHIRRRVVSGMLLPSLITVPQPSQWGAIALVGLIAAGVMVGTGIRWDFLRWQWAVPPSGQTRLGRYGRILALTFWLPAVWEELVFRLVLLPSPEEVTTPLTAGQWGECLVSLGLYMIVHPLMNGPGRNGWRRGVGLPGRSPYRPDRGTQYQRTFCHPVALWLTAVLGGVCTLLYVSTGSIWPSILWHWIVVAVWLIALGGDQRLHPRSPRRR